MIAKLYMCNGRRFDCYQSAENEAVITARAVAGKSEVVCLDKKGVIVDVKTFSYDQATNEVTTAVYDRKLFTNVKKVVG